MDGFDWLKLPQSASSTQKIRPTSPAPPSVSFGGLGPSDSALSSSLRHNASADNVSIPSAKTTRIHSYSDTALVSDDNQASQALADDTGIPLSLTTQDLTLAESRTYIRWYSDILARTETRTISMVDVYKFLHNFKLSAELKDKLNRLFFKILNSINIGEFFALLRLISHCLQGNSLHRGLIRVAAPVPAPPSILSKKRQSGDDEEDDDTLNDSQDPSVPANPTSNPLDLDSFTQFMLTGERPDDKPSKKRSKKLKSVTFSDQIVTDVHESLGPPVPSPAPSPSPQNEIDYSLPMDQLLNRISSQSKNPDAEEQQILDDMGSQLNHFRNLNNVDTASIGGVPSSAPFGHQQYDSQLLRPNMTGPAQMSQYLQKQQQEPQQLRPNVTGPYDMMKIFSPSPDESPQQSVEQPVAQAPRVSLQLFTDQMTGSTAENTLANSRLDATASPNQDRPLPPPPVPAARRARSLSSPTPNGRSVPPPPPPSRRRGVSSTVSSPPPQAFQVPPQAYQVPPQSAPALPPKVIPTEAFYPPPQQQELSAQSSGSTTNILDDLKELQAEVDRIRDMTGGF
ncbi:hypothetical protein CANTEDRAFT_102388 [Yamadazyma tenuis ATCC 10573]|uniref:Uncharacterized protein n=1 Tax=Candida tenuis (strain ATCC 10573 / BCRC 21748 / CBS 615 / JCM 9827 / NBRC 10315 / NRRL Y-1498 / VKM Y-70) TaxID=590646 RepID=G3AXQ8_CANTC|nr:uncharacterized protein CANTEDRAFT_102388 [Yamadazyma tenuis ATCC 10573]EGV65673.1 hypothetical protein CANTEDRAFT_102388 [Yamadazyma tenuis ATCC 10573]